MAGMSHDDYVDQANRLDTVIRTLGCVPRVDSIQERLRAISAMLIRNVKMPLADLAKSNGSDRVELSAMVSSGIDDALLAIANLSVDLGDTKYIASLND
jgi:hypothetical protein